MFGELPSWGFYIRHAKGIKMKNVKLSYVEDDFRPALVLDDANDIDLAGVQIPTAMEMPMIVLNNTSGVNITNLAVPVSKDKAIMKSNYK